MQELCCIIVTLGDCSSTTFNKVHSELGICNHILTNVFVTLLSNKSNIDKKNTKKNYKHIKKYTVKVQLKQYKEFIFQPVFCLTLVAKSRYLTFKTACKLQGSIFASRNAELLNMLLSSFLVSGCSG